jgi:hypothetical protein
MRARSRATAEMILFFIGYTCLSCKSLRDRRKTDPASLTGGTRTKTFETLQKAAFPRALPPASSIILYPRFAFKSSDNFLKIKKLLTAFSFFDTILSEI